MGFHFHVGIRISDVSGVLGGESISDFFEEEEAGDFFAGGGFEEGLWDFLDGERENQLRKPPPESFSDDLGLEGA